MVLHGRSLVLDGIAAILSQYAGFEVISIDACRDATRMAEELNALDASAVIVDLGNTERNILLSMLDARPTFVLVGIDAAGDKMLVLSGAQSHSFSSADLVQVIERQMPVALAAPSDSSSGL